MGKVQRNSIVLNKTNEDFIPNTTISFSDIEAPHVCFVFSDDTFIKVALSNITNELKFSPHQYSYISITEFTRRMSFFKLITIDHTGFNLPFFNGIHPKILELREILKNRCLYHTFPKHLDDANWDFILPATKKEINSEVKINYSINRKPKIEIVSFDKSSTPLIQIDVQINEKYEDFAKLFVEALKLPDIKSVWVYIENDFGIDMCFILNETENKDWSYNFVNDRLL